MTARTKSALLIVVTLGVGVALGVLASNYVVNQRLEKMRELRSRGGYAASIIEAIGPNSEAQRAMIEDILKQTHRDMEQLRREWSRGVRAEADSMRMNLTEILTAEQVERLDEWYERYQSRGRRDDNGRDRRGGRDGADSSRQRRSDGDTSKSTRDDRPPPPPPGDDQRP